MVPISFTYGCFYQSEWYCVFGCNTQALDTAPKFWMVSYPIRLRCFMCTKNQISGKKSFSMILRLEMILSVVFYERINIIFYEKNLKLTKNNTFNNVFCNTILPYYRFLIIFFNSSFFKSWIIKWVTWSKKYFSFPIIFVQGRIFLSIVSSPTKNIH